MEDFLRNLIRYKSISIIGMEKNTGKTTTLNFLISAMEGKTLGLTSIGMDGEEKDVVTATVKPRIYINKGTIIATAKLCMLKSDVTFEILEVLNINTPIGEVIVVRALTNGFIELAGPSTKSGIKEVIGKISSYGAELTIVDGALSRKTFAEPAVTEGCILCTGAALSENIKTLAEETALYVKLLSTEEIDKHIKRLYEELMDTAKLVYVYVNSIKKSQLKTSIGAAKEVIGNLKEDLKYVFIKGIVTDNFIKDIINSSFSINKVTFVVEDGTKLFIKRDSYLRFLAKGGNIRVINKINIIGISVNPTSPSGVTLDYEKLKFSINEEINRNGSHISYNLCENPANYIFLVDVMKWNF